MPDEAITESANVLNNLIAATPAWGAVAVVLIIMGMILFLMQRSHNQFIFKMAEQREEQLDKTIDFVSNYAAMMQSDRDTTQALSKVVSELNRDCRLRFDKDGDSGE